MKVLWDTLQSFTSCPLLFLQFRASPFSLYFPPLKHPSKLLIQGSSWWWSSFFHGLFPSGWRLLSPLLLCLPLHLHGEKSPLKDLIEAQRSSLHRSSTSKLPSRSPGGKSNGGCACYFGIHVPANTAQGPTIHWVLVSWQTRALLSGGRRTGR